MSDDNNETKKAIEFEEIDFKPTPEERKKSRLEQILSMVQKNWKISVIRSKPTWCSGHLETLYVDDPIEDMVDIEYLIRTWGGHKLQLMVHDENGVWVGGGSVPLFSYPPKVRGKELIESEHFGYIPPSQKSVVNPPQYYPPPQQQQSSPSLDLGRFFDFMQKNKNADITPMLKIMEFALARQQPAPQPVQMAGDMIQQMAGMMSLFREMKSMFGNDFGGGEQQSNDSMMPMMAEVIKGLMGQRDAPPARAKLAPPSSPLQKPPMVAVPDQTMATAPTQQQQTPQKDKNLDDFAAELSRLSAQDAADVVSMAMGLMPEDKQTQAMKDFIQNMQDGHDYLEQIDESSNNVIDEQLQSTGYPGKNTGK